MGLRGPGAYRRREAAEATSAKPRALRWERRGLSRVGRVIAFMESLPITKGKLTGHNLKLLPAQRSFIEAVYGRPDADRIRIAVRSEPRGNGKGLALNTPLPTPTGWTTMAAVRPGDMLLDERGGECRVTMVSSVRFLDCYRIKFSNGEEIVADGDHLWLTRAVGRESKAKVRDTRKIFATQRQGARGDWTHRVSLAEPMHGRVADLPIDPYVLGAWLGDGAAKCATLTCGALDLSEMVALLEARGLRVSVRQWGADRAATLVLQQVEMQADGTHGVLCKGSADNLQKTLRRVGLLRNKHIPAAYLRASRDQRLALLQGLMDTDGSCSPQGQADFSTSCPVLAGQFGELLASFGIKFSRRSRDTIGRPSHRFIFTAHRNHVPLFRLRRKLAHQKLASDFRRDPTRAVTIVGVERVEAVPTKCLQVDSPSKLFLCGRTMLPTHNTGLVAGLMLCHLLGPEAEARGECYSAAIDRQQAALLFTEMEAIIFAVPEFAARVNIRRWHKNIEVLEGAGKGSTYEALSADARRAHGLAPSFWAYDELAQAKDRTLLDNLQTAMGKRKRSLGMIISTQAADDEHPLSQIIDDGLTGLDPGVVVHLTTAPPDADPFDEAVIRSVNPAFGTFLDASDVFSEAERARRMPSFEPAFRNLRLNQRVQSFDRVGLCRPDVWAKGDRPIDEALFTSGRPVFGGLDLSARVDLTALVLAVEDDEERLHLKPYVFTPRDTLRDREERDRVPYDAWARSGHLIAVPGTAIDYDWIAQTLAEVTGSMNLVRLNFDRWRIEIMVQALNRLGFAVPLEPFGQGYQSMSPAIEAFEEFALPGRIIHGGHPVLRWCVGNTAIEMDAARNRKPTKAKSWGRIDAAVAALMAVAAAKASGAPVFDVAGMIG